MNPGHKRIVVAAQSRRWYRPVRRPDAQSLSPDTDMIDDLIAQARSASMEKRK